MWIKYSLAYYHPLNESSFDLLADKHDQAYFENREEIERELRKDNTTKSLLKRCEKSDQFIIDEFLKELESK